MTGSGMPQCDAPGRTTPCMERIDDILSIEPYYGGTLVPTMGALHEGHLDLIRLAQGEGPVVVTLFVNPTQFAADEDFERYPRTLEHDCQLAAGAGADVLFTPTVDLVYPPTAEIWQPPLPGVATDPGLEDRCRPHFFAGVCQVVARLFDLTQPSRAVFGEKDFQQLRVIESMVQMHPHRWPSLSIVRGATRRETDGLAMSSRNAYLSNSEQIQARTLFQAMNSVSGFSTTDAEQVMGELLHAAGLRVDYAVVRDAHTLEPPHQATTERRALVAAFVGDVRLIDNAEVL